jgi:glycosyltransferase involved in cell wall biosynthesis
LRLGRRARPGVLLVYNRLPAHVPALVCARLTGWRCFMDIEDGDTSAAEGPTARFMADLKARLFDALCSDGALLACSALQSQTRLSRSMCYYGVVDRRGPRTRLPVGPVRVLLGGTVEPATGATLLADAVALLRREQPAGAASLELVVTGAGSSLEDFRRLETSTVAPSVRVRERLNANEYAQVLSQCHVGLALKLSTGSYADTTFPSKVVEFASAGLLVVTTDISDVRRVLGAGAVYVTPETPRHLADILLRIARDRDELARIAEVGARAAASLCDPVNAGQALAAFLCGEAPRKPPVVEVSSGDA